MVQTITENGRFIMATPFNRDFVADIKTIGGRWNAENKTWSVAEQDAERAREILREHYGLDGSEDSQPTVTVLVDASAYQWEREINLAGSVIARRWHRDSQPVLGEDVIIAEGKFPWSGGSHAHPRLEGADVVLEWREVPASVAAKLVADGEHVTIVEETVIEDEEPQSDVQEETTETTDTEETTEQEDADMSETYTISDGEGTSYSGTLEELRASLLAEADENRRSLEEWEDQLYADTPTSFSFDDGEEPPVVRELTAELLVELAAHVWDVPEKHVQLTAQHAPITAGEFLARLHWLGITPTEFARMVGINARTARAWASGKMTIPATIRRELDAITDEVECLTDEVSLESDRTPIMWPQEDEAHAHYPGYERLPEQAILNAVSRAVVEREQTAYIDSEWN